MPLANTLTGLIPTLYAARDVVSRELIGLIPAVTINASDARVALNQPMRVPITPPLTAQDIVPAMTPPTPNSAPLTFVDMAVTKSRGVPIPWSGEEQQSINESGPGINNVLQDQFAQGMRTLANEMESDLAGLFLNTSRAFGTAGTPPFSTTVADSAQMKKILDDNGAPQGDRQLVVNTSAGVNIRSLPNLTRVSEAGTAGTLRQGTLFELHGFNVRESAQIKTAVKGTGAAYTTNTAGYAVGATSIVVAGTVTGSIIAGDRITIAGDPNIYIVQQGVSAAGQTLIITAPGLRVAVPAAATAITVNNTAAMNMAFHRSSLILLARAPYLPNGTDMAVDRVMITDPVSNITFEVALYKGYHANFFEISASWGVKGIKPENAAVLLG